MWHRHRMQHTLLRATQFIKYRAETPGFQNGTGVNGSNKKPDQRKLQQDRPGLQPSAQVQVPVPFSPESHTPWPVHGLPTPPGHTSRHVGP